MQSHRVHLKIILKALKNASRYLQQEKRQCEEGTMDTMWHSGGFVNNKTQHQWEQPAKHSNTIEQCQKQYSLGK